MYFFICFAVLLSSAICQSTDNAERNPLCKERNTYIKVDGKCDSYIECRNYQWKEMECPDGLHTPHTHPHTHTHTHTHPKAVWPAYACGYPQDVPCVGRGVSQPANPTANCAHQYGDSTSPVADPNDCGAYRICNGGISFKMFCPAGLAFNPDKAECDWPEKVPTCNVKNYLSQQCPPAAFDIYGNPVVTNHKYEEHCYSFYSCINGHARILSCDSGLAFNPVTGHCEDADRVKCIPTADEK